eukprot:SAG11_NODE_6272_length_1346_cov_1.685646_1_plen_151_part_10
MYYLQIVYDGKSYVVSQSPLRPYAVPNRAPVRLATESISARARASGLAPRGGRLSSRPPDSVGCPPPRRRSLCPPATATTSPRGFYSPPTRANPPPPTRCGWDLPCPLAAPSPNETSARHAALSRAPPRAALARAATHAAGHLVVDHLPPR